MTQENKENNTSEVNDWADMINVQDSEDIFTHKESFFQSSPEPEQKNSTSNNKQIFGKTGVQAILDSSFVSYERLPMLEVVFDRLTRMMATSLRNFTQDNVEVAIESIESMRFGEYINSLAQPTLLTVFKAEEWDNFGLISIDSSLAYSTIDILLGGRRGTAAMRIEGRTYTSIELTLIKDMIMLILSDLSTAFDPVTTVNFTYDRSETNPRFAAISRLSNAVIVAKLRVDMEDRGGKLDLMIPYATLEPVKELLLQMFMGEHFGKDPIWEEHLVKELWKTDVELKAVLAEKAISLGEIAKWEKGSFLPLNISPSHDIDITCGDCTLMKGTMGRKEDNIVIKINKKAEKNG